MDAFQHSFNLDKNSSNFANLQGNIVSVLQAGCFFGALASFYVSDTFGRKWALIIADIIFIIGSLVQTLIFGGNISQLYVGRVIGGFGVGLISAVVPTYIGKTFVTEPFEAMLTDSQVKMPRSRSVDAASDAW
jgi:SP family sugar:H+ symporter-like MFS transporter